jgi:hypothetical protein
LIGCRLLLDLTITRYPGDSYPTTLLQSALFCYITVRRFCLFRIAVDW